MTDQSELPLESSLAWHDTTSHLVVITFPEHSWDIFFPAALSETMLCCAVKSMMSMQFHAESQWQSAKNPVYIEWRMISTKVPVSKSEQSWIELSHTMWKWGLGLLNLKWPLGIVRCNLLYSDCALRRMWKKNIVTTSCQSKPGY